VSGTLARIRERVLTTLASLLGALTCRRFGRFLVSPPTVRRRAGDPTP